MIYESSSLHDQPWIQNVKSEIKSSKEWKKKEWGKWLSPYILEIYTPKGSLSCTIQPLLRRIGTRCVWELDDILSFLT